MNQMNGMVVHVVKNKKINRLYLQTLVCVI